MATAFGAMFTVFKAEQLQAASIASYSFDYNYGAIGVFEEVVTYLSYEGFGNTELLSDALFEDLVISVDDVGTTFTATQSTDSSFNKFVSNLTNGLTNNSTSPEIVYVSTFNYPDLGGFILLLNESDFVGGGRIDLKGFNIDSINLTVNSLEFSSPGNDPNGDGIWTNVIYNGIFTINGSPISVPEPGLLPALLAATTLSAGSLLKRKQLQNINLKHK